MNLYWKTGAATLALLSLSACAWNDPHEHHDAAGTVERFIDPQAQPGQLPPCLASRIAQIQGGTRFAAIRYRHWASHFKTMVYAEVPAGMSLQLHQEVRIEPGQCSHDELAVIVQNEALSTSKGAM
ncbi:MAG: hypothetical protein JO174_03500 [Herbaspirillum sp.]|nr:hypothetical protein [Herbaspirillum sp.]